jgi:hypothetical protein
MDELSVPDRPVQFTTWKGEKMSGIRNIGAAALGLVAAVILTAPVFADDTCSARAADKKLAGAAKTSFMKKCETDATKACDAKAKDKKLAGAAQKSFVKKCVTDSVGMS